jgi:hypothetical protein
MAVRYINVTPVSNLFSPVTRAFGDIAIVGAATGSGPVKTPIAVTNPNDVTDASNPGGKDKPIDDATWFQGDLGAAVRMAFEQTPGPTTVWAVKTNSADADPVGAALTVVAKLDVQIVVVANMPLKTGGGNKAAIEALAAHVNTVSTTGGDGMERIGVAMLDKGVTDTSLITTAMAINRMVMIAHNSSDDAAAAIAGTIAGYQPQISLLLKQVTIDNDSLFSDSDVDTLNTAQVNWLADPTLLPGRGVYMGQGYTLGPMKYIDVVRTIDDISFRLKATLIESIGNLRMSRAGLRSLVSQMAAVMEPLKQSEVIESYTIFVPLLVLLDKDPGSLTDTELAEIHNAQSSRTVDTTLAVEYAGAMQLINIIFNFN